MLIKEQMISESDINTPGFSFTRSCPYNFFSHQNYPSLFTASFGGPVLLQIIAASP